MILARDMMKHAPDMPRWEALGRAWKYIQENLETTYALYFTKRDRKDPEIITEYCNRIVKLDLDGHLTFKGTGRPLKPGQRMFVDVSRMLAKEWYERNYPDQEVKMNEIISTYKDRITTPLF